MVSFLAWAWVVGGLASVASRAAAQADVAAPQAALDPASVAALGVGAELAAEGGEAAADDAEVDLEAMQEAARLAAWRAEIQDRIAAAAPLSAPEPVLLITPAPAGPTLRQHRRSLRSNRRLLTASTLLLSMPAMMLTVAALALSPACEATDSFSRLGDGTEPDLPCVGARTAGVIGWLGVAALGYVIDHAAREVHEARRAIRRIRRGRSLQ